MEPSIQALGGEAPLRVLKRYFLATRPMFLAASVLPVLVGSSWGAVQAGAWQWWVVLLAVLDIALIHAGVNVLNDVFDNANGTDRANQTRIFPFTGGSRFIQNGVLSAEQMRTYALLLLGLGIVLGAIITLLKGPGVLVFGLLGLALGILYSLPPIALASRGLGELAVAFGFGVLPVTGAAWLQTGILLDTFTIILAVPISCWVANILIMNEVPDLQADVRAGKATLVVRFGLPGARWLYRGLSLIAIGASVSLAWWGPLAHWGVIPVILLGLLAVNAASQIVADDGTAHSSRLPIQKTLTIHAVGCVWLILWPWF